MKKFIIVVLALVSSAICFTRCTVYKRTLCPSYVVCYTNLNTIDLSIEPSNSNCILIHHGNDIPIKLYGLGSTGEDKERYHDLCRKHNDLTYNQHRSIREEGYSESVTYNECDFSSIEVMSDIDFDETHSAGENLSDIVRFMSWSPYKYIKSGYSKFYHYDARTLSDAFNVLMPIWFGSLIETKATCYPVDKMVKDLTADDLILIGYDAPGFIGMLYFEKQPKDKGDYVITVKIHTDTGETISNTVKMSF